jgi:hypothetical protein
VRRGPAATLHCPYCYQAFSVQAIQFRCSGLIGLGGRRCRPELDKILSAYTGREEILPPVFPSEGQSGPGACPSCRATTTVQICPACHRRLPAKFGEIPSYFIALAGAKESGKTVFLTVLVHELMHRLGEQLHASISAADDYTGHQFAAFYNTPLYQGAQLLSSTTAAETSDRAPLIFRLTLGGLGPPGPSGRRGRGLSGGTRPTSALLSLFDPAGEELKSELSAENSARYLAAADGIVLLLDPLQMPAARELAAPGIRLPSLGASADAPVNVLRSITQLMLRTGPKTASGLIGTPLAIAFSKIDALQDHLEETSPLRQAPVQTTRFDERDSLRVHTEVQRLLGRWNGTLIDRTARQDYRHHRYFGISALGETPTPDNKVSPHGIHPYRVGHPLTWLLSEFGLIAVQRG